METIIQTEVPAEQANSVDCLPPADFLESVADALKALRLLRRDSVHASALMSTGQAAQLAAEVEAASRTVEYLQVVCAGALETHRVAETFGATSVAVQGDAVRIAPGPEAASGPEAESGPGPETAAWNNTWAAAGSLDAKSPESSAPSASSAPSVSSAQRTAAKVQAEFRTTADYMRARLRISRGEAQRRLKLASVLLPASGGSGQSAPAALSVLAGAAAAGEISSVAALIIAEAVDQVAQRSGSETAEAMENNLASIASRHDTDFLVRTARRWVLLANQDGAEPSGEELRRFQGVFSGRKKNGLNHLSIYCTAEQHETLLTVMNAAAGPQTSNAAPSVAFGGGFGETGPGFTQHADGSPPDEGTSSRLDRRTRPQRLLSGLVEAAKGALAGGGVPASGGLRPQIMVTIDAESLLKDFNFGSIVKDLDSPENRSTGQQIPLRDHKPEAANPGSFAFTGPVPAAIVRKLACDAEMLPVVLSGRGRILDVGRAQRLFPPHLRKALHARDGGCAFPGCSIPGPWTEAHHIQYWNRGGPTSTDNGVLLCSHHHHEVHKENWEIRLTSGVPWFVPPPYVDPDRVPLRNTYFRAAPSAHAAG
ncbi:hypothetical protein ABIB35_001929 [Arthrobacter sp. UYP6]|uniref:HNH endonuclease n=1 Tax=Arthrobacter sp. UYP6 TaxID=1756378 RepID=UPI003390FE62